MNDRMRKFYELAVVFLAFIFFSCANDLHYNAKAGNIANIQKILEGGDSIEKKDQLGNTPLIVAALSNEPETVEYLCKKVRM